MGIEIIEEEIVRGCGRDGIQHVCVKKLTPRRGRVRFSKRWIPGAMPEDRYWAGREMDLINLLSIKRALHVVQLLSYSREESREEEDRTEVVTLDAGLSLDEWLQRRVESEHGQYAHPFFRVEEYLKLLRGCLIALKALHTVGFVHCDIKADNICLAAMDEDEDGWQRLDYTQLTLIDFAFSISADLPLDKCLPIDWTTVSYLSNPMRRALEQDHGLGKPKKVEQIDYAADLYSLGVMAESLYSQGVAWPEGRTIRGADIDALLDEFNRFDKRLSWRMRRAPVGGVHDDLIERIDRLLGKVTNTRDHSCRFRVGAAGRRTTAPTPITPMAGGHVEEAKNKPNNVAPNKKKARVEPAVRKSPPPSVKFDPKGPRTRKKPRGIGFAVIGVLAAGLIGFGVYQSQEEPVPEKWVEVPEIVKRPESPETEPARSDPFEREQPALVADLVSSSTGARREAAKKLFRYVQDEHSEAKPVWESQAKALHQRLQSKPADEAALAALKTMAEEEAQHKKSGVRSASGFLADYEKALADSHETMSATKFWKSDGKSGRQPKGWDAYVARLRAAAATGDRYAAVWLASLEEKGLGVKQDRANAFKQLFYILNHTDDNPALHQVAQTQIGALLKRVRVEKDERSLRAIISEMERSTAKNDAPRLQLWLGALYWDLNDRTQARNWYQKASRGTDSKVRKKAEQALQMLAGK